MRTSRVSTAGLAAITLWRLPDDRLPAHHPALTFWEDNVRGIIAFGAAALAAYLLVPAMARAADPGFCNDYARVAVDQARFARSMPWCAPGAYGPHWTMDYRVHYDWCLGARYRDAQGEREARHAYVESCRRH